jgi:hypothetical protein
MCSDNSHVFWGNNNNEWLWQQLLMWQQSYICVLTTVIYVFWQQLYMCSDNSHICVLTTVICVLTTAIYVFWQELYMCSDNSHICVLTTAIYVFWQQSYMCSDNSYRTLHQSAAYTCIIVMFCSGKQANNRREAGKLFHVNTSLGRAWKSLILICTAKTMSLPMCSIKHFICLSGNENCKSTKFDTLVKASETIK